MVLYNSGLWFATLNNAKCRENVWKDSRKEHVVSLLREQVDVVW